MACLSETSHNSSSLQIIHSLVSHLIFDFLISKFQGKIVQTKATGTFKPVFIFGAQQTIGYFCQLTSTIVQLSLSLSGCFSHFTTSQTKTFFKKSDS